MLDARKRVYVYFNLHRRVWSLRQGGLVVDHRDEIVLRDCRFLVSEAGRQRVLREHKKNVHAGISGFLLADQSLAGFVMDPAWEAHLSCLVEYNPYKHQTFVALGDFQNHSGHAEVPWPPRARGAVTHAALVRLELIFGDRRIPRVDVVGRENRTTTIPARGNFPYPARLPPPLKII